LLAEDYLVRWTGSGRFTERTERETLIERREPNWSAGIALEMLFGERTTR
jgi:hypothetical protein